MKTKIYLYALPKFHFREEAIELLPEETLESALESAKKMGGESGIGICVMDVLHQSPDFYEFLPYAERSHFSLEEWQNSIESLIPTKMK